MKTLLRSLAFIVAASVAGTAIASPNIRLHAYEVGVCNWSYDEVAYVAFNDINAMPYAVSPGDCRPFNIGYDSAVVIYGSYDDTFDTFDPNNVIKSTVYSSEIFDIRPRRPFLSTGLRNAALSQSNKVLPSVSIRHAQAK